MKIYVLTVNRNVFVYDEIADVVVLAESPEQALEIARKAYDAEWEIENELDLDKPMLIASYIHHG